MRNEPVYRRRRAGALVILLVLIVGIVFAIKFIAGGSGPEKTPAADKPKSSSSASKGPTSDCAPADLMLTIATDATSFSVGEKVPFVVSVTYQGEGSCLIDGSDTVRTVVVTSGQDRIWSSADCADKKPRALLMSNGDVDRQTVTWKTQRSAVGCGDSLPKLRPGTYKVQAVMGDVKSENLAFTLS